MPRRPLSWSVAAVVLAPFVPLACGSGTGPLFSTGGAGTGGGGGSPSASVSGSTSTASGSSLSGSTSTSSSAASSSSGMPQTCTPPMAHCSNDPMQMCETNLSSDPNNCGKCGYSCNGGTCTNGACVLAMPGNITYKFGDFQCITTDGTNVYFMASSINGATGSGILYVPTGGGTIQQLAGTAGQRGAGLVAYGNFIYWVDYMAGLLVETPKPGQPGTSRNVVTGITQPIRVAVDAANVYWTGSAGAGAALKANGQKLWVSNQPGGKAWGIAIDATDLYYTDPMLGEVVKVDIGTGVASVFAPNQMGARGLFGDTASLYWTTSNGEVMTSPKATSSPAAIVQGQMNPQEMVVDTTQTPEVAYWMDVSMTGDVSKANATPGATATVVAPNQVSGQCVAVDATSVYWAVYGGTQLLKAPK